MKRSFNLYYLFPLAVLYTILLGFCIYKAYTEEPKDKNLQRVEQGQMSIVTYQDHSYIVWSINLGGGICHNPDCECYKKEE